MGRNGHCSGIHSEGNLPTQLNLIWKLGIMNERRQLIIAQSGQSVSQTAQPSLPLQLVMVIVTELSLGQCSSHSQGQVQGHS